MNHDARRNVCVILIAPGAFKRAELRGFFEMLSVHAEPAVRCLVRIGSLEEAEFLASILSADLKVEIHVLTHVDLEACELAGTTVFAPPGLTSTEADSLAVALSDVVLVGSSGKQAQVQDLAARYRKAEVPVGPRPTLTDQEPVEQLLPRATLAKQEHVDEILSLDPRTHEWFVPWHQVWGRSEAFLIAMFGLVPRWLNPAVIYEELSDENSTWRKDGPLRTLTLLLKSSPGTLGTAFLRPAKDFVKSPDQAPYFGPAEPKDAAEPKGWRGLCPDIRLRPDGGWTTVMTWFDAFERASGYGARCYRDMIWFAHLFAAVAVFSALVGFLWETPPTFEVVSLAAIAGIVLYASRGLQRRWMACRLGAEELRASIVCLTLFATPGVLLNEYRPGRGKHPSRYAAATADVLATRALRDHGLSKLDPDFTPRDAARWIRCIAHDQLVYHRRNQAKLERLENAVAVVGYLVFFAVFWVVAKAFPGHPPPWALLLTAGGPAIAAAFHGAITQLHVVDRAKSSEECAEDLEEIVTRLDKYIDDKGPEPNWSTVRLEARETADVMSKEVEGWHVVLARHAMSLPA